METASLSTDSAGANKLKLEAQTLFAATVKSVLPRLLTSFDSCITGAATGDNALHELLSRIVPNSATGNWLYSLAEALIQHGVDINQRNKEDRTVALSVAAGLGQVHLSACSLHLLLQHGADINAQDSNGDTLLHHLIRNKALGVLQNLYEEGDVSALDYFLVNCAGQMPADLAAASHAQQSSDESRQILDIIRAQIEMWGLRIRPTILACLSEPLIPDLAQLVLGYVDGSGLAFGAAAEAEVEAPDPAAAADHE